MTKLATSLKSTRLILAFTLLLSGWSSQRAFSQTLPAWTPEVEKQVYTLLYDQSEQLLVKDDQRKEWANCAVQKLKAALPQGMDSVTQDSISRLAQSIGASCIQTVSNAMFKWSPMMVQSIKQKVLSRPELNAIKEEQRAAVIDCLVAKLQKEFPDGFTIALIEGAAAKYAKDCVAEISAKKP
jgi:hypothetical protein